MESVAFTVEADWLINFTRSIWADERNPDRAIRILRSAFPTMEILDVVGILSGKKKLVGDSDEGMDLVDDNTETTDLGNPLALEQVISLLSTSLQKAKDERDDVTQLLSGTTFSSASSEGLVRLPLRRKREWEDGEITLDDVAYENIQPEWAAARPARRRITEPEELPPPEPPKPQYTITTDSGWLSPDGKFYPCGYMEHLSTIDQLVGAGEVWKAEKLGWIKMTPSPPYLITMKNATEIQAKMLIDYSMENKLKYNIKKWLDNNTKDLHGC